MLCARCGLGQVGTGILGVAIWNKVKWRRASNDISDDKVFFISVEIVPCSVLIKLAYFIVNTTTTISTNKAANVFCMKALVNMLISYKLTWE